MAIYHLSVKVVSRGGGRSATAAAAYRAGELVHDRTSGQDFDYTRKGGVEHSEILAPDHASAWVFDRAKLWNRVEEAEIRKDAQLAREVEVALPIELNDDPTHKHAVASISPGGSGVGSYSYDANGNMSTRLGYSQVWSSYNLPTELVTSGGNTAEFYYGPDRQRKEQIAAYYNGHGGTGTETTIYALGLFEYQVTSAESHNKYFISVPGGTQIVYDIQSVSGAKTTYITADHLGSGNLLIDSAGAKLINESYSAYGYRRTNDWSAPLPATSSDYTTIASTTRRGYTDGFREMLDNVGLVHMNGRVYDPVIGRFLSPDTVVTAVGDSQRGNPYSYVENKPLTVTDPTGMRIVCRDACGGPTLGERRDQSGSFMAGQMEASSPFSASFKGIIATNSWDMAQENIGIQPLIPGYNVDPVSYAKIINARQAYAAIANSWAATLANAPIPNFPGAPNPSGIADGDLQANNTPSGGGFVLGTSITDTGTTGGPSALPTSAFQRGNNTVYVFDDGAQLIASGGTLAWRNNNPGNMVAGQFAVANGAIGTYTNSSNTYAIFPDAPTGGAALQNLLQSNTYQPLSIDAAIARYAPAFQNNTGAYQNFIMNSVGVPGSTLMNGLTSQQFNAVVVGIETYEGWTPGTVSYIGGHGR
jgi:RHS repeat-associated protein